MRTEKSSAFTFVQNTEAQEMCTQENWNRKSYLVSKGEELIGRVDFYDGEVSGEGDSEIYIEVFPSYRGLGLSKEIYQNIPDGIRPQHLYAIVQKKNIASMRLHTSLGFKQVHFPNEPATINDEEFVIYSIPKQEE